MTQNLPAEARELLAAIREALDLPYGATPDDHDKRLQIRQDNATRVVSTLRYVLDRPYECIDIGIAVQVLREGIAENRGGYVAREAGR